MCILTPHRSSFKHNSQPRRSHKARISAQTSCVLDFSKISLVFTLNNASHMTSNSSSMHTTSLLTTHSIKWSSGGGSLNNKRPNFGNSATGSLWQEKNSDRFLSCAPSALQASFHFRIHSKVRIYTPSALAPLNQ